LMSTVVPYPTLFRSDCGSGIGRADHIEARGDRAIGAAFVFAGVMRRQDQPVTGPPLARTLETVPEQFRPGVGLAREVGPADRLYEQEIAGKGQAVVCEERDAAEGVPGHVRRAQRGAPKRDRVP